MSSNGDGTPILQLSDIHTYYGSIHALKGISLEVHEGEIVTLLGANAKKDRLLRSSETAGRGPGVSGQEPDLRREGPPRGDCGR